jgi:hypothetical protein
MVYQVSDIRASYLVIHFVRCAHYVKLDSRCAKITKFGQLLRVTLFWANCLFQELYMVHVKIEENVLIIYWSLLTNDEWN